MFNIIKKFALQHVYGTVHDELHIIRVLSNSILLSKNYCINIDVLIASSLLHDVGRSINLNLNNKHAILGASISYDFLLSIGWTVEMAQHVRNCISTHSLSNNLSPKSFEAKILFDADKLDLIGAIGIARALMYRGENNEYLYHLTDIFSYDDICIDNLLNNKMTFINFFNSSIKNVQNNLYTPEAKEIAAHRTKSAESYYNDLLEEIIEIHKNIGNALSKLELTF